MCPACLAQRVKAILTRKTSEDFLHMAGPQKRRLWGKQEAPTAYSDSQIAKKRKISVASEDLLGTVRLVLRNGDDLHGRSRALLYMILTQEQDYDPKLLVQFGVPLLADMLRILIHGLKPPSLAGDDAAPTAGLPNNMVKFMLNDFKVESQWTVHYAEAIQWHRAMSAMKKSAQERMQFSAAQPWCSEWTSKLVEARRFQKVPAQKWAAAGARYVSWVCPEEKILRPGARHGGFAFLFHELDEEDVAGRDRFFEVVGKPLGAPYGSPMTSVAHESTLHCALSFRVVGECPATTRHMEASQRRCFKAASNGRWALLAHILAEFPQLATAKDDTGQTVLHCIALGRPKTRRAAELLRLVHAHHGDLEATNDQGQRAYELGDLVWFDYWDVNKDGHLSPEELIPALTAAYEVGDLGRQWIESYVNTHYRQPVLQ
eukprot:Skav232245  [mRNA]  locus=scaffold273:60464:71044:- [translate_table: standard]